MRKQYHFRKIGRDTWIWDIERLVSLSQHVQITVVPLTEIRELDEVFWFNHPSDRPTCRSVANHARLIQEAQLEHPIILCPEGRIMDGMHRVCKAWIAGKETIGAIRLDTMPEPDFINVPADELPYE